MRNFSLRRFCFLCLFINLFFPLLSAYAQPPVFAKTAIEDFEKYRSTGEAGPLKSGLHSVNLMMDRMAGSLKDPNIETLSAAASAADTAYQATGDEKYLEFAVRLAAEIRKKLDSGTAGPESSPAIRVLMDLYHITGVKTYKEDALKAVKSFPPESPEAARCRETAYEFIIVGKLGNAGTDELLKKSFMFDDPCRVVVMLDPARNQKRLDQLGYEYPGRSCLFVCSDRTCFPPVYPGEDLTRIKQSIKKLREMK